MLRPNLSIFNHQAGARRRIIRTWYIFVSNFDYFRHKESDSVHSEEGFDANNVESNEEIQSVKEARSSNSDKDVSLSEIVVFLRDVIRWPNGENLITIGLKDLKYKIFSWIIFVFLETA